MFCWCKRCGKCDVDYWKDEFGSSSLGKHPLQGLSGIEMTSKWFASNLMKQTMKTSSDQWHLSSKLGGLTLVPFNSKGKKKMTSFIGMSGCIQCVQAWWKHPTSVFPPQDMPVVIREHRQLPFFHVFPFQNNRSIEGGLHFCKSPFKWHGCAWKWEKRNAQISAEKWFQSMIIHGILLVFLQIMLRQTNFCS